jgi:hypothetical protein
LLKDNVVHTFICRHCKKIEQIEGKNALTKLIAMGWRVVDLLQTGTFPNRKSSAECPGCQGKPG